jgi:integrase
MASIYRKGVKLYVSWYDQIEMKRKNKSTGLDYSKENLKKAKVFAVEFQKALDQKSQSFKTLGIKKNTIGISIEHFLKINGDKNKYTIRSYMDFFNKFTLKFKREDICTTITKLSCEDWLISYRKSKLQPNTLFGINKELKKYLRFLFEYNYIPMFVLNRDVTFKPQTKAITIFSQEDIITFFEGLKNKNNNFKCTFYILLYTGLRPSDIYNLKVEDINLKAQTLKYYSPKTKTNFMVPFHPLLVPIIEARINEVRTGKLLDYASIYNMGKAFRRYMKQIGMTSNEYNLRTFRKTFITTAHECGLDLATVSKLAGHFQITTTEKYYNQLSMKKKSYELNKIKFYPVSEATEVQTEVHSNSNSPILDGISAENSE